MSGSAIVVGSICERIMNGTDRPTSEGFDSKIHRQTDFNWNEKMHSSIMLKCIYGETVHVRQELSRLEIQKRSDESEI